MLTNFLSMNNLEEKVKSSWYNHPTVQRVGDYIQKGAVGLLAAGIGLSIIGSATAKDQQQYNGKPNIAEVETNDPIYDNFVFLPLVIAPCMVDDPRTPYEYAQSNLPEDIAVQFQGVAELNCSTKSVIDLLALFPDYALDVLSKRPDILGEYTADGAISSSDLSEFNDLDSDGVSNSTEITNGTSLFNPYETNPSNMSDTYIVIINGYQVTVYSRYQDNHMTADPLELYHSLRKMGFTDDEILMFHRHDYPVVVNTYWGSLESGLYEQRGVAKDDWPLFQSLTEVMHFNS